jgi:Flp pilus assembly pilin Flp
MARGNRLSSNGVNAMLAIYKDYLKTRFAVLADNEDGVTSLEYAVLAAVIVTCVAAVFGTTSAGGFGTLLTGAFKGISTAVTAATAG